MVKKQKCRLDKILTDRFPDLSRTHIQSFIVQRKVFVDGQIVDKAGTLIADTSHVELYAEQPKYVSRAGFKLEKALEHFKMDVKGFVALDAGISTGGFTDCLIQHGAQRVYGVDVGYGQVHEKVRTYPNVVVIERTNLRYLQSLPEKVDLVTLDLSFISVLKVIPAIKPLIKPQACIIILIKPQFEADRCDIATGGVVKNETVYRKVIERVQTGMIDFGFHLAGITESPILGAKSGNKEFLALFVPAEGIEGEK